MRGQCNADNAPPYLNHGSFNSGGAAIGLVLVFDKGVWSCYMHPQYIYAKYMLAIRYTHYSNEFVCKLPRMASRSKYISFSTYTRSGVHTRIQGILSSHYLV